MLRAPFSRRILNSVAQSVQADQSRVLQRAPSDHAKNLKTHVFHEQRAKPSRTIRRICASRLFVVLNGLPVLVDDPGLRVCENHALVILKSTYAPLEKCGVQKVVVSSPLEIATACQLKS